MLALQRAAVRDLDRAVDRNARRLRAAVDDQAEIGIGAGLDCAHGFASIAAPISSAAFERAEELVEVGADDVRLGIVLVADRGHDGIDVAAAVEERPDPRRRRS